MLVVMLCTFDGETIYKALDYGDSHAKPARSAGELKNRLRELIALCGIVRYVAFKRRRIGNKENPTDWRQEQAEEFLSVFVGGLLAAMSGILRQWQLAGIGCKMEQKLDRWAMRLKKYFWMYLQTNANVNTLGCYAFRMRKAVDETGYNKDTIEKLLDGMVQRGMILYDATTREIFLLHWGKTNWNRQTATLRAMKADLKEIRSEMIKFKINTQLEKSGIFTKEGENDKVSGENDKAENAEISAKTANKENNSEQMRTIGNNQGGEGEGEGEGEKKKEKEKILKSDSEAFAAFWEAYPNKKNKAVAVKHPLSLNVAECGGLGERIPTACAGAANAAAHNARQ